MVAPNSQRTLSSGQQPAAARSPEGCRCRADRRVLLRLDADGVAGGHRVAAAVCPAGLKSLLRAGLPTGAAQCPLMCLSAVCLIATWQRPSRAATACRAANRCGAVSFHVFVCLFATSVASRACCHCMLACEQVRNSPPEPGSLACAHDVSDRHGQQFALLICICCMPVCQQARCGVCVTTWLLSCIATALRHGGCLLGAASCMC